MQFPTHPDHLSIEEGAQSELLAGYSCPAGSAVRPLPPPPPPQPNAAHQHEFHSPQIFFTEAITHVGPVWTNPTPRAMVLTAYAHLATQVTPPTQTVCRLCCAPHLLTLGVRNASWQWHRLAASGIPREVLASLPRRQLALFRLPWIWDGAGQATNSLERFEALVTTLPPSPVPFALCCPLPPARPRLRQQPEPEPEPDM
eukprot:COSAG04_NODE_2626_length_3837_cov_3.014446_3_plen_200_part_00